MNFDVDVDSFFSDGGEGNQQQEKQPPAVTVHQVYGHGVDWSDTDRITISHMFACTK